MKGRPTAISGSEWATVRQLADQAFSRASGAPLREGNEIVLLKDAAENYPAWLEAIEGAQRTIHFEMYIVHEDNQGRVMSDALLRKAGEGVQVRLLYDWMGGVGKTSRAFWNRLRAGGVDVRCYNPPRFDSPLGWISRDHRKAIVVDGKIGFVTGLCVGQMWVGDRAKKRDPWRDTGIQLCGPAVADVEAAFADAWAAAGNPVPHDIVREPLPKSGDVPVRVVATAPTTAGLFRVDLLVAALARKTLWLTDAYYGGTPVYVQALRDAAKDGVDVRLLVPGATDIPLLRPLSRAGYRPLLEAGVRIFEWNGSMMHAKTAVADGRWARVGSTNLNIASWIGNRELDVIVEHQSFAKEMEAMFVADLALSTEVVLERNHVHARRAPPLRSRRRTSGGGSGKVVAGAVRVGNTVTAVIANSRVLEPVEANSAIIAGLVCVALSSVGFAYPRAIAVPFSGIVAWFAVALLVRGAVLFRSARKARASSGRSDGSRSN